MSRVEQLSYSHVCLSGCAGLSPRDIDILVVNCSLFNPTPSLSAMIVNHFKMRGDVISYNLAGMGCSAGVIAIGLAQRLLKTEPGKYALVVSTENITQVHTALSACAFVACICSPLGSILKSSCCIAVPLCTRTHSPNLQVYNSGWPLC